MNETPSSKTNADSLTTALFILLHFVKEWGLYPVSIMGSKITDAAAFQARTA